MSAINRISGQANRLTTYAALDLEGLSSNKKKIPNSRILDQYGLDPVTLPKSEKTGIAAAVKRAFESLESLYDKHVPIELREKVRWITELSSKSYKLIGLILKVSSPLIDIIRESILATLPTNWPSMNFLKKTKILSILAVGGVGYSLAMNIKGVVKSIFKNDLSQGIDKGLMIIEDISDMTGVAGSFIGRLKELSLIAATEALSVAGSALVGVGAALSFASIALNAKHWYQSAQFRKRMDQKFGGTSGNEANFGEVVKYAEGKSNKILKQRFGVRDGGLLKLRLNAILQKDKDNSTEDTKENINTAMKAMKKRLITKDICHGLKILAGVISIIATAVLLFTPAQPLGLALFAVATAIGIGVLITEHVASKKFEKTLNQLAPDNLEKPVEPKQPENKNDLNVQDRYQNDMFEYHELLEKYNREIKYVKPLHDYKWKASGRKRFRNKTHCLRHWTPGARKPKGDKAVDQNGLGAVNPAVVINKDHDKAKKLNSERLGKLEEKGMKLDEIKNWKPKVAAK